jgi:hypothetical protein
LASSLPIYLLAFQKVILHALRRMIATQLELSPLLGLNEGVRRRLLVAAYLADRGSPLETTIGPSAAGNGTNIRTL